MSRRVSSPLHADAAGRITAEKYAIVVFLAAFAPSHPPHQRIVRPQNALGGDHDLSVPLASAPCWLIVGRRQELTAASAYANVPTTDYWTLEVDGHRCGDAS